MKRIKKQHIGKIVLKGSTKIVLSDNMTHKELTFIENMISSDFIETVVLGTEITEETIIEEVIETKEPIKTKRKRK